jgi:hypothetical protein
MRRPPPSLHRFLIICPPSVTSRIVELFRLGTSIQPWVGNVVTYKIAGCPYFPRNHQCTQREWKCRDVARSQPDARPPYAHSRVLDARDQPQTNLTIHALADCRVCIIHQKLQPPHPSYIRSDRGALIAPDHRDRNRSRIVPQRAPSVLVEILGPRDSGNNDPLLPGRHRHFPC